MASALVHRNRSSRHLSIPEETSGPAVCGKASLTSSSPTRKREAAGCYSCLKAYGVAEQTVSIATNLTDSMI